VEGVVDVVRARERENKAEPSKMCAARLAPALWAKFEK